MHGRGLRVAPLLGPVVPGVFVPKVHMLRELMNPCAVVSAARKACPDTVIDVKLGCIDPENRVAEFAAAGADAISFHPEATKQPAAVANRIRDAGVAPGIVLNPGTAVAAVAPLLDMVDLAVVMLVSPGHGGPKYTEQAVEKVRALRELRPDLHISVDGGVNAKLAPELRRRARTCSSSAAPSSMAKWPSSRLQPRLGRSSSRRFRGFGAAVQREGRRRIYNSRGRHRCEYRPVVAFPR